MKRILLKALFNTYLYMGIIVVAGVMGAMGVFLMNSAIFSLEQVDPDHCAGVTLWHILTDLWPAVAGTFLVTLFAVGLAIPMGLVTGIFISEYTHGRVRSGYIFVFKLLAGTPSIVIGVFGFVLLLSVNALFAVSVKTCFLVSGLSLSVLVLPYIVHSTVLALSQVSVATRISGLTLGAKRHQNVFRILLPEAFVSLSSGVILAIGRACEDTAVIMLTGVAAYAGLPSSITSSFEALPFYIYFHTSEYQNAYELTGVFVAATIVILLSCAFILTAYFIRNRIHRKLNA